MGKKVSIEDLMVKINEICLNANFTFLCLCDKQGKEIEYTSARYMYVKYQCNKCKTFFVKRYHDFIRTKTCSNCEKQINILPLQEILTKIEQTCRLTNSTFLCFCDKTGTQIEWNNTNKTFLKIQCNICGYVRLIKYHHFISGRPCKKCSILKTSIKNTTDITLVEHNINKKCTELDFSFLTFCNKNGKEKQWKGLKTYLLVKCNKCNNSWIIRYDVFLKVKKCIFCQNFFLTAEESLNKIKQKCNQYNYSFITFCDNQGEKIEWRGATHTHLLLHCNNCDLTWKTSYQNFIIQDTCCPICCSSHLERQIKDFLDKNDISYDLHNRKILNGLEIDFYLPIYHIAIECQGIQHFKPIDFFGGKMQFDKQITYDVVKRQLCEEKGIKLIYYSNLHIDYPYQVYEDLDEILKEIKG